MAKCLSRAETLKVLQEYEGLCKLDEEECLLATAIENARAWDSKLTFLSYFLSQVLEGVKVRGGDCWRLLQVAYNLQTEMWLEVQQFDSRFVEYMLSCERINGMSLEEQLIEVHHGFEQHKYNGTFRC